jgi:hypothetical protein
VDRHVTIFGILDVESEVYCKAAPGCKLERLPEPGAQAPERLNFKIQFAGTTRYTSLASILEINSGEKT